MVLLGLRAAVRRGVSLCVHTAHNDPWRDVSAPFHLREISMLTALDEDSLSDRAVEEGHALRHCLASAVRKIVDDRNGPTGVPQRQDCVAADIARAASYEDRGLIHLRSSLPSASPE